MTTEPKKTAGAVAAPDLAEPQSLPASHARPAPGLRRWLAFGTGVGIEIRDSDLHIAVVRVRPHSVSVVGTTKIPDFRAHPAAEWGNEIASFLQKCGVRHVAVSLLLPRRDVIVRQLHMPGVADRDLASAVQLQIDSLHPFADDEIYSSWSRLGRSAFVMVGIVRRDVLDQYFTLFREAGVKLASFTWSAAALYSASRLITVPPSGFVLANELDGDVEVYGESESRGVYSATLPALPERALALGRSELRLDPDAPALKLSELLPVPMEATARVGLAYATALAGACSFPVIDGNLLPADRRSASSRIRLIPTVILAATLTVLVVLLALQSRWADMRYLAVLHHEIGRFEPRARRVDTIDKTITATRSRSQLLDDFKRRAKLDMDTLAETTKLLPPPGWVTALDMDRTQVQLAGEAEQAAELLKKFDSSPWFERSEFTMPISRIANAENFRIRTQRQTPAVVGPGAAVPAGAAK